MGRAYQNIRRGPRDDLGPIYWRSSWEANIARFLNWLLAAGEIVAWEYEPRRFTFPVIRGATSFLPDFRLTFPDGTREYLEVKGYEKGADRQRYEKLAQHYPETVLTVLGPVLYKSIAQRFGGLPCWEHPKRSRKRRTS